MGRKIAYQSMSMRTFIVVGLSCASIAAGQTPGVPAAPGQPGAGVPQAVARRPFVPTLTIGAPAPAPRVNVWLKNPPGGDGEREKVTVVGFWSPRAPACRRSEPLLSEIAQVFRERGVQVISIATVEPEGPGLAGAAVKQMGDKAVQAFGYDTTGGIARSYMQPSGESAIPVCYVVNTRGQIAWIGHPMDGLEDVLAKVTDGTWDLLKAAADAASRRAAEEKSGPLVSVLEEQFAAGETDKALATMDALAAIDPPVTGEWVMTKFAYLLVQRRRPEQAYAYARAALEGPLKDDAETLKAMAWMTLAEPGVDVRDVALARQMANRADELTKHADVHVLDTLAKAQFESGDVAGAVETEKKAVELGVLPTHKKEMEGRLKQYVAAKGK